jgi:protein-disulfide isomerase
MKKNKNMAKNLVLFTAVIIGLLITLFFVTRSAENTAGHTTFAEKPSISGQPIMGDEDAAVTIIEFGDYKCPGCKAWHEHVFPQLKEKYIDTGQARIVYINTIFQGEESQLAALAGESVWEQDADAFWTFHDELFNRQPQQNHNDTWVTEETLVDIAETHTPEIDTDRLEEDIKQQSHISLVEEDMSLVREYNIEVTPSIMINNILVDDPFDVEEIESLIDKALEEEQS